jgi:hypothetical protein
MKKSLIAAAAACVLLSTSAFANEIEWAKLANGCLKQKGVSDVCYVTNSRGPLQIYCNNKQIAEACSAQANAELRPARFAGNGEGEREMRPEPRRRHKQPPRYRQERPDRF